MNSDQLNAYVEINTVPCPLCDVYPKAKQWENGYAGVGCSHHATVSDNKEDAVANWNVWASRVSDDMVLVLSAEMQALLRKKPLQWNGMQVYLATFSRPSDRVHLYGTTCGLNNQADGHTTLDAQSGLAMLAAHLRRESRE